jgi:DNA-binding transcriptional MerR regulator
MRYYEEAGLLTPGGPLDRPFNEDRVDRLLGIKQMKPLGFTVHEGRELLRPRRAPGRSKA